MTERPILFNGPMVRAILEGRKTQTRRPVACPTWAVAGSLESDGAGGVEAAVQLTGCMADVRCPFGVAGDKLWVRETWACPESVTYYRATDEGMTSPPAKWRPSIHMPRWASRIDLDVTRVRFEKLNDVTADDARAEGFGSREEFIYAFRSIYGEVNPPVWVIDFKRVRP